MASMSGVEFSHISKLAYYNFEGTDLDAILFILVTLCRFNYPVLVKTARVSDVLFASLLTTVSSRRVIEIVKHGISETFCFLSYRENGKYVLFLLFYTNE